MMSISFRFWILFGVIVTSCFISVYCTAAVEISVEEGTSIEKVNEEHSISKNSISNVTGSNNHEVRGNSLLGRGGGSNRSVFARCFSSMWEWIQEKTYYGVSGLVENKIISGKPENVKFYLYPKPEDKDFVQEIVYDDQTSLQRSHFRSNFPLKLIVHGFTNHHISEPVQQIKNAYLTRVLHATRLAAAAASASGHSGDFNISRDAPEVGYNVILVDWGKLADPKFSGDASNFFYGFAVKNVPLVGKRVAEFVMFLRKYGMVSSLNEVHLIGFSLGAHVVGNAGNILKELNGGLEKVGRITGLDPAGPSYYKGHKISSRQLSSDDATFVDIIHTNQGGLGILENIGHADFFPNGGGPIQKPCLVEYGQSENENALVMLNTCSHSKAPFFFSLSINRFISACRCTSRFHWMTTCPCKEKSVFGEFCDPGTRGSFYFHLED